jgi:acetylornithine aminotransferase/acetylornithine/N-succinyldiaminopimelate aminotransferase
MAKTLHQPTYPADPAVRDNAGWAAAADAVTTPNYGPRRLALVRGAGTRVWDADGNEYLDFLTGISVNNLGHCHPRITEAIARQAATLVHCANLYVIPTQIELARLLVEHSFADRAFFGNSGAEANEAAIKIARRFMREKHGAPRPEIVCFDGSFHGRTMATLTATGQAKIKIGFEPLLEGFVHVPFNDLEAARAAVGDRTGAILVEPIQGEGGVNPASPEFLRGLRALCDERGLLLIFDEIQCGLGRAGSLFCYERYGIEPDIMTLAKSLGGGLAMGAMLCREAVASAFGPGSHGSTMGGNALTAAAGLAYVGELIEGDWPAHAAETGRALSERLRAEIGTLPLLVEIRGHGLMIGIQLRDKVPQIQLQCERSGLLIGTAGPATLRLLPPLNVRPEEVEQAVSILAAAVREHAG